MSLDQSFGAVLERARPVVDAFADAGFSLYAVGGAVRDLFLGADPLAMEEFDFTTDARPDDIERLLKPHCEALWDVGRRFGTVGGLHRGLKVEITTFRTESYVDHSRKPAVEWGNDIIEDLSRRDFTINAVALNVVALSQGAPWVEALVDPFGGIGHLNAKVLCAPSEPVGLFRDDPLRMLRAARFAARFDLAIDPSLEAAAVTVAPSLTKVSVERIQGELDKLLVTTTPSIGLDFIVRTGLATHFLPELPALRLEQDPIHHHKDVLAHTWAVVDKTSPHLRLRMAALLHDIGKPATRAISPEEGVTFRFHDVVGARLTTKRLNALKYAEEFVTDVSRLVELHLRFHTIKMGWSDSAVRRYARDAGHLLDDLNELTRCDCTTRNRRKAAELSSHMDVLEERIVELRRTESLDAMRPALDGDTIMNLLGLAPGPAIKRAINFLMEIRFDEGEIDPADATNRLRAWWTAVGGDELAPLAATVPDRQGALALDYLLSEREANPDLRYDEAEALLATWLTRLPTKRKKPAPEGAGSRETKD